MGYMSAIAKYNNRQPKPNSKRQQQLAENPKTINVIACKNCHQSNVTLIRGTDSYYCKYCYSKMQKKGKN